MILLQICSLALVCVCHVTLTDGSFYDVYDDDVIYTDKMERLRRAADNCNEKLPPPDDVSFDRVYATAARISWSEVIAAEWYAVSIISPITSCVRGEETYIEETSVILRDLDADTPYVVNVIAYSGNGCSEPKEITFSTSPGTWKCEGTSDVPGGIKELKVPSYNVTSSSVLVVWAPTPVALSYVVEIDPENPLVRGVGKILGESTTIRGLDPGNRHTVTVTAQNGLSKGPPSSEEFITRVGTPSNFEVTNASSTFFKVSWDDLGYFARYTVMLNRYVDTGETLPLDDYKNISASSVYFRGLEPATRYQVTLQAFNLKASSEITTRDDCYTKLPTTSEIRITNVTERSVFSDWDPVDGAINYRVILRDGDQKILRNILTKNTSFLLQPLKSAAEFELQIIALNNNTKSLPGTKIVYSRLEKIKYLNVDKDFVQDTSAVIRWELIRGAKWYDVEVTPKREGNFKEVERAEDPYIRIEGLTPGTFYRFTVRVKNHPSKDTASLPSHVDVFTRLSRPLNMTILSKDVTHNSMRVTWSPVKLAESYLLLVFDCSGAGRTVGKAGNREVSAASTTLLPIGLTTTLPPAFLKAAENWNYPYTKVKAMELECEDSFGSVEEAIMEGERQLPSNVIGQGRTSSTDITLTNMLPNTRYEIIVISGTEDIQSNPNRLLQYTKLSTPSDFTFDSSRVLARSLTLNWNRVSDVKNYQLDIFSTSSEGPKRLRFVRKESITPEKSELFVPKLLPSTNYTFKLTARNQHTTSFPVYCNVFTRLLKPLPLYVIPDKLTTTTMMVQWPDVRFAEYYNVSIVASNSRMKRGTPHYRNVTEPSIYFDDLLPNTFYQLWIEAGNRYARSLPATTSKYTNLNTPANFTIVDVTASSIKLTWEDVDGRETFKLSYEVCPRRADKFRQSSSKPSKLFRNLLPNTCYNIAMKAVNPRTESDVSRLTQHTKLTTPQQFVVAGVDDGMLRITWREVKDAELYHVTVFPLYNESEHSTSPIPSDFLSDVIFMGSSRSRRYIPAGKSRQNRVRRSEEDGEGAAVDAKFIVWQSIAGEEQKIFSGPNGFYHINVSTTSVRFSQLESGVKYKISLQAINQKTDSLPSTIRKFTELRKPQSVEARDVTNSSLLVRWRPVAKATYYQVRVDPEVKTRFHAEEKAKSANTTETEIQLEGLKSDTKYTISVLAENSHAKSKKSIIWKITKLSPVENLRVIHDSVMHDQFHIKWEQVAFATQYFIVISPPPLNQQSRISLSSNDATEMTIENLKDGTNYQVTVRAENKRTEGVEKFVSQYTRLLTPEKVTIIPSSLNSTGFTVQWLPVPKANKYRIELANQTSDTARVFFVDIPEANIADLSPGHPYTVRVIAENTRQQTFSHSFPVSSFTKLETPSNLSIRDDDVTQSSMIVTWDPVPLATTYRVRIGVENREHDHHSVFAHLNQSELFVSDPVIKIVDLLPGSYYLIDLKASNEDTESFPIETHRFTKLTPPDEVSLLDQIYMDTEADVRWQRVEKADYYALTIYEFFNRSSSYATTQSSIYDSYDEATVMNNYSESVTNGSLSFVKTIQVASRASSYAYVAVDELVADTFYLAAVQAHNADTMSDSSLLSFKTKSPCSDDYHFFPNTHLSQTLPRRSITNSSVDSCLRECCSERAFECRSISLSRATRACLLFADDRNTAPPLAISTDYDHYERKFWKEVSGFQIRSITHNNVAIMNDTVELTLTFVYLGKKGCVEWDFGDGDKAYHSILETDCSYLCSNSADENCTVIPTKPNLNENKIVIPHDYDMEDVFVVAVNVTDFKSYEVKTEKIAINERGCIYPSITIEDQGKMMLDPKILYRSKKLLLSATPVIVCNNFPGVNFKWSAVSFAADRRTITGSLALKAVGSEILVPPLTFPLGMYRVSVAIEVLDDHHDLRSKDYIYLNVEPSPLVADIKGGKMRTVGARHIVTWDSSSVSFDPDVMSDESKRGLEFVWLCKNYTDYKFRPFSTGSCFHDVSQVIFTSPGVFHMNTSLMVFYQKYEFLVLVKKGKRLSEFRQQVVVKEGDPPDFQIRCAENCKDKMNPTQSLAIQAVCYNCKAKRNPEYKWRLYKVVSSRMVGAEVGESPTNMPPVTAVALEDSASNSGEDDTIFVEQLGWEMNTTTGSDTPIIVLNKNTLEGGHRYVLRINISMDGLDGRVDGYADFTFLTNLPPFGGVCSTVGSNCFDFIPHLNSHLGSVSPKETLHNKTVQECKEYCCLTREFMCLSLSYNTMTSECALFEHNKESSETELQYSPNVEHFERLFYRGGAVVDEVMFECRDWKDEGSHQSYPKDGPRAVKATVTYKFTTLPQGNSTKGLLLYFGNVQKTPGISMALGNPNKNFSVFVIAQVCDVYGECAISNVIYLQVTPPDSSNIGSTLTGFTSGNASKLAILSNTGNSKAAAQLVQSISSLINVNEEEIEVVFANYTSTVPYTTPTPTTTAVWTTAATFHNGSMNGTKRIAKSAKTGLRSNVVDALSTATGSVTSIDNLQQMTSAMNSITEKTDEIDAIAQMQASDTVKQMAGSLSSFADESNKEDVTIAAANIVGSLGSVAEASETNMDDLQAQLKQSSEINYAILDEQDLSPDEFEYYNKRKLRTEKKRVRRSALGSQDVVANAVNAMDNTGDALLGKQLEGEAPVDVSSDKLQMKVEKTSPSDLGNRNLSTGSGTSLKLPDAEALLGKNATNSSTPVDMNVMAFSDNPFGFGEDAAFINSPVTMLKIGTADGAMLGGNDNTSENHGKDSKKGVGISVPSKFDPHRDMMVIQRNINDTGLSISKFEVKSTNNAILIIVEPEDDRAKFDVYLKLGSKPSEEESDFHFHLPRDHWKLDDMEDQYKIFISEKDFHEVGIFFIGIKDILNASEPIAPTSGRVRRRRSVRTINSTTYHLLIATPGCRRFDQDKKAWTGDGCWVDERSTPEITECVCDKLSPTSIFSAEFFVPPNTINFATVFAKINISDNPAVFSTVIALLLAYLLMLMWARRMDRKDAKKWSLKSTIDNRKEDKYLYQVTIFTGHGRYAATQSNVSCIIFGENGKTKVRRMAIREEKDPFTRSSVVHFLIREPKCLGPLTHIHIWHDNTGNGEARGWYLDQVVVQDIRTGNRCFFICDQWLAVDHDDGKVDRILPVASPENLSTFHRLFISTTAQKFTEDHLWISLFYRPTKSNFVRTQRLACCLALLFMTMISNAMFFESGSNTSKAGTRTLRVGPFTLSPLQLWTSFCATLLVVPVTTTIMTLFKKAKTKEQERIDKEEKKAVLSAVKKFNMKQKQHIQAATLPEPSDLAGYDAVYQINDDGTINAKPNIVKREDLGQPPPTLWPHYCIYIAWLIATLAVLLSGFFAILYSFEWGRDKAERWLANMMLSFWQSVLIVQPIKVILLAMFVATIVKKPDHQALDSVDVREVKEVEKKFVNLCAENIESEVQEKELEGRAPPKPPSKKRLRRARRLRQKEKVMSEIIWEVITYFLYIMVLLFLCHGNRDSKGLRITETIKKTFVQPMYGLDSVTSVEYFWRFVDMTLLPNLYPSRWYNGEKKHWRNRNFIVDEQSYRVGPARMRQLRVEQDPCPMVGSTQEDCRGHFKFYKEEKRNFTPGWKHDVNDTELTEDNLIDDPTLVAWKHQSWLKLKGVPLVGELAVYPGSGFSAELGVNHESAKLITDELYKHSWINQQTRAVIVEFTLYNPNVNLFTSVQLLTEFPPVGAAVSYKSIMTFRLYQYLGAYGTVMLLAQIIFVLHLLYCTASTIRRLFRQRKAFFKDAWNDIELFILSMDWIVFSLYIFQMVLTSVTLNDFHENKRKYVNFQQVMTIDSIVGTFLALLSFFGIVRFLKLLRFNRKMGMLTSVLKNSAKQWPGFFVMAAVFFISFIHIGFLVFSPFLMDFKNILSSMETMFSLMMGRPLFDQLQESYRIVGPFFYFSFCFTAVFIIINVLIAIINESYGLTLEFVNKQDNDYDILDFMMKRFARWSGITFFGPPPKEKRPRPAPISPSKVPLPPLTYNVEGPSRDNLVELQKTMDKYVYDLETKYSKHLNLEELRDEVIAEMEQVHSRNANVHKGILLDRQRGKMQNSSMRMQLSRPSIDSSRYSWTCSGGSGQSTSAQSSSTTRK